MGKWEKWFQCVDDGDKKKKKDESKEMEKILGLVGT